MNLRRLILLPTSLQTFGQGSKGDRNGDRGEGRVETGSDGDTRGGVPGWHLGGEGCG